jgi:CheY-like chemotaxis protein
MARIVFANEYFQQLTGYSMQEKQFVTSQPLQAMGSAASEIIHDFNNLFTAIMVYSGLLSSKMQNDPQLQRYSEEITAAAQQGSLRLAQLLRLAELETANSSTAIASITRTEYPEEFEYMRATLLLVEDDDLVRQSVDAALSMRGYKILPAANAEEAMNTVRSYPGEIELVVTDLSLPVINGVELAQTIRAVRPQIKVLFMSGSVDHPHINELAADRESFFKKPFTPSALAHKIEELLNRPSDE